MRYLVNGDHEAILKLRAEGWMIKDLATKFEVCEATISKVINGKVKSVRKNIGHKPKVPKLATPQDEFQDFSQLPDDVLFKEIRECHFMG